ncbi:hypothetical protein P170DRAFT_254301 [Aspergillus steynii IBT 23096]|uniref:Uncharacterized protein n=1 Tax=Aspergillus steynii IBT 23096 TaxID=1392250 RepID=A0A2I2FZ16_9EURO|nr:uncharacterized protein P170DRAFT_254301 [Aspergillus steynii IBT 23096]PLB45883.1 hypothetical protein P170DRAFT_254301 [Aspergillus steynii IBT 23096]
METLDFVIWGQKASVSGHSSFLSFPLRSSQSLVYRSTLVEPPRPRHPNSHGSSPNPGRQQPHGGESPITGARVTNRAERRPTFFF